jgi:hypothetical protein
MMAVIIADFASQCLCYAKIAPDRHWPVLKRIPRDPPRAMRKVAPVSRWCVDSGCAIILGLLHPQSRYNPIVLSAAGLWRKNRMPRNRHQ